MKRIIHMFFWGLFLAGTGFLFGFVNVSQKKSVCKDVDINIDYSNGYYFVAEEDILNLFSNRGDSLIGQPFNTIDVREMETLIRDISAVSDAEVYSTIEGNIRIEVKQKRPIIRVMNIHGEDFYIDDKGELMMLSNKYTAHVVVANGHITEGYPKNQKINISGDSVNTEFMKNSVLDDLYRLAEFIDANDFWRSQIIQIYVNNDREIELVPRVGMHSIIFGEAVDIEKKFKKLWVFYQKGLKPTGWNKYKTIDLRYKNQVVCSTN